MTTQEFSFTIGINPGYFHDNSKKFKIEDFVKIWNKESLDEEKNGGLYIPIVINPSLTVYKEEWGCPVSGEKTITVSGVRNPLFSKDMNQWQNSVKNIVMAVSKELKQATVSLIFREVTLNYLKTSL